MNCFFMNDIPLFPIRPCLNFIRPSWNGWNGTRLFVVVRSIPSCLYFQATEQPTRTENNPTDFCGGTAQLDPKTGVPSRGQRVLLTQRMNFHANIQQGKSQSRRCEPSKSHLREKTRGYDIAIAARRRLLKVLWNQFHEFARNISPESRSPPRLFPRTPPGQAMALSRGSCRGRVIWRPHIPHPMLAMPSHAISCTPIPPWSSSKCRNTPSTNQLHVFAFQVGRSVWLNKDYCLNTSSSSSKFVRQGGNAWNLFNFDNQSAAFFC